MSNPRLFVIGAGLAGLSAAVENAKRFSVTAFESAGQAGGRCRSYFDATLNQTIDNGNHLLLSGNHAVMRYLKLISASDKLAGPARAGFDFADVRSGERWRLSPNGGPLPFWVFLQNRRVPGTAPTDYLSFARLAAAKADRPIGDLVETEGPLWEKLLAPFLVAALNTEAADGSALLAGKVIRETLAKGEAACRPRIAHPTLAAAFIDPALGYLAQNGAQVTLNRRVRKIVFDDARGIVMALEFPDGVVAVDAEDRVILSVPPWVASDLVPGLEAPNDFRSILNLHFAIAPPVASSSDAVGHKNNNAPEMLGVIGGTAEWIFTFPERISVTVSNADRLIDEDREKLARMVWSDIVKLYGLPPELPVWQVVKEKRATFAATPAQNARRPGARTRWRNLFLAGDWTDTGLPATIEGAIRSGVKAAQLAHART